MAVARESGGRVLYVGTIQSESDDPEMQRRVERHRMVRPADWDVVEAPPDLVERLRMIVPDYDTILLDGLTLWVATLQAGTFTGDFEDAVLERTREVIDLVRTGSAHWIIVSDEVGLGIVPLLPSVRAFRDALGRAHQALADVADETYYMIAGYALPMKGLGARRVSDSEARGNLPRPRGP